MAREVNNPLAGIRNAFALFRDSVGPEHEHYELLELVDNEIERISSIIHQMYQLYRRPPQPAVELSLSKIVRDVSTLLNPIMRRYQVQLVFDNRLENDGVRLPEGHVIDLTAGSERGHHRWVSKARRKRCSRQHDGRPSHPTRQESPELLAHV